MNIVATLPPVTNRHGILVTPVVGIVSKDFSPVPNPEEVAAAFMLPLSRFLSATGHSSNSMPMPSGSVVHFFSDTIDGKEFITWGLTAAWCIIVACYVYDKIPQYEYASDFVPSNIDKIIEQSLELSWLVVEVIMLALCRFVGGFAGNSK